MINVVPLAQWIRRVPTEHEIPGSSPGMKKIFIVKINLIILKISLNIKMLQLMVMYQIFINKKFNHFIKKIQEDVIIGILIQNLHQNVH